MAFAVAEIHFFWVGSWGEGATPPKFTREKAVFSPLLGQDYRKFVIFREGGGGGGGGGAPPHPQPHQDFRHWAFD